MWKGGKCYNQNLVLYSGLTTPHHSMEPETWWPTPHGGGKNTANARLMKQKAGEGAVLLRLATLTITLEEGDASLMQVLWCNREDIQRTDYKDRLAFEASGVATSSSGRLMLNQVIMKTLQCMSGIHSHYFKLTFLLVSQNKKLSP